MKKFESKKVFRASIPNIYNESENRIEFGFTEGTSTDNAGNEISGYFGYSVPLTSNRTREDVITQIIRHVYTRGSEDSLKTEAIISLSKGDKVSDDFSDFAEWRSIAKDAESQLEHRNING